MLGGKPQVINPPPNNHEPAKEAIDTTTSSLSPAPQARINLFVAYLGLTPQALCFRQLRGLVYGCSLCEGRGASTFAGSELFGGGSDFAGGGLERSGAGCDRCGGSYFCTGAGRG